MVFNFFKNSAPDDVPDGDDVSEADSLEIETAIEVSEDGTPLLTESYGTQSGRRPQKFFDQYSVHFNISDWTITHNFGRDSAVSNTNLPSIIARLTIGNRDGETKASFGRFGSASPFETCSLRLKSCVVGEPYKLDTYEPFERSHAAVYADHSCFEILYYIEDKDFKRCFDVLRSGNRVSGTISLQDCSGFFGNRQSSNSTVYKVLTAEDFPDASFYVGEEQKAHFILSEHPYSG
jgi:hypothetical protein